MNEQDQTLILLAAAAGLFIVFFLTRWIHRIEGKMNRMDASIQILAEIAKAQGVAPEKIEAIISMNNLPKNLFLKERVNTGTVPNPAAKHDPYALPNLPELVEDKR